MMSPKTDSDSILAEIEQRHQSQIEAKIAEAKAEHDQLVAEISNPRRCSFSSISGCIGIQEFSVGSAACVQCRTLRDFLEQCPTRMFLPERREKIIEAIMPLDWFKTQLVAFLQKIVANYFIDFNTTSETIIHKDVTEIPQDELYIILGLETIVDQLEDEENKKYDSDVTIFIKDIAEQILN